MRFIEQAWYVVAAADEVSAQPQQREVLGRSILLYRASDRIMVTAHLCPHRFAPLALGKVVGDTIECPYHGLRFDQAGRCVANPTGDGLPAGMRLKVFPSIERYGHVWVWMGDAAAADPALIPDLGFVTDPRYRRVSGMTPLAANYLHVIDNSMDSAHIATVHRDSINSAALASGVTVTRRHPDGSVEAALSGDGAEVPDLFRDLWHASFDAVPDRVTHWADATWFAATTIINDVGVCATGGDRESGIRLRTAFFITPESADRTRFYWVLCRNFLTDVPAADDDVAGGFVHVLKEEDGALLSAIQDAVGSVDIMEHKPALMACDKAIMFVRRAMRRLLDAAPIDAALEDHDVSVVA